jgi:hypothetical protein
MIFEKRGCTPLGEPVKLHAGIARIYLKIEYRGLYRFLLVVVEFGEAVSKGVCDEKLHIQVELKMILLTSTTKSLFCTFHNVQHSFCYFFLVKSTLS